MSTTTALQKKTTESATPAKVHIVRPAVDIYENSEEFLLHVEMPGVVKDDIAIELDNNVLSLSGIRHQKEEGSMRIQEFSDVEYRNSFSIPETIEITAVTAKLEAGVLHLTLPKLEAVKPRVIEVH
jgi:HSP20 family molecular chaperone IbpA